MERGFIFRIDDGRSQWRGAVQARRPMRVDGLAQEDGAVWRRGGVDGRPSKIDASIPVLKMDRWKTAAVASESAPDRCVLHTRQVAWLGTQVLDVRLGYEVCLVLSPEYLHPFINWIGVATDVA